MADEVTTTGAPLRAAAQVVALEPEGPDGHGVNWLAGKRPKPGDLLFGGVSLSCTRADKAARQSGLAGQGRRRRRWPDAAGVGRKAVLAVSEAPNVEGNAGLTAEENDR